MNWVDGWHLGPDLGESLSSERENLFDGLTYRFSLTYSKVVCIITLV